MSELLTTASSRKKWEMNPTFRENSTNDMMHS
jgi:hypothetical protein